MNNGTQTHCNSVARKGEHIIFRENHRTSHIGATAIVFENFALLLFRNLACRARAFKP